MRATTKTADFPVHCAILFNAYNVHFYTYIDSLK